MKEDASAYFISGILLLMVALTFFVFGALGGKMGDLIGGGICALTAMFSFYQYSQKSKQENKK